MINIWENKQQKEISTNEELNNKINDLYSKVAEAVCKKESRKQSNNKLTNSDYVFLYSNHYKAHKTSWD